MMHDICLAPSNKEEMHATRTAGEEKQYFRARNCKDKAAQSLALSPKRRAEIAKKAASARWNAILFSVGVS
jgi:hypothetical protein